MALMLETCNVMVIQVIICLGGSETDNIGGKYHLSGTKLGGDQGGGAEGIIFKSGWRVTLQISIPWGTL